MQNSRLALRNARSDEKPHNSSKGKGIILEQPYKPGFVDDKDLETVKMAVDKELGEIANAFYETTERTADTITRIERLEIGGGTEELRALIEQVDKVSKENDVALAQRITTVEAESSAGLASVKNEITAVSDKLGTVEAKWGLTVQAGDVIGSIQLGATAGGESEFRVRADKFVVSNGSGGKNVPFEIIGNNTRINSLFVKQLQSDNWDNTGNVGWAVTPDGKAWFQNASIKGNVKADSGYFNNATMTNITGTNITVTSGKFDNITSDSGKFTNADVTGKLTATSGDFRNVIIREDCTVLGKLYADQVEGLPVGKSFGPIDLTLTGGGWHDLTSFTVPTSDGRFNMGGLIAVFIPQCSGLSQSVGNAHFPYIRVLVNNVEAATFYSPLPEYDINRYYQNNLSSPKLNLGSAGSTIKVQYGVAVIDRAGENVRLMTNINSSGAVRIRGMTVYSYNAIDK